MHWIILIGIFVAALYAVGRWLIPRVLGTFDQRPFIQRLAEQAEQHTNLIATAMAEIARLRQRNPESSKIWTLEKRLETLKGLLRTELDAIEDAKREQDTLEMLRTQNELERRISQASAEAEHILNQLEERYRTESKV